MSYESKDSLVLGRQLDAQSFIANADLTTEISDHNSAITIDNSTLTATVITFDAKEPVSKCFKAQVTNRTTGANVAIAAAPVVSGNTIAITCNGTGIADCAIEFKYKINE